ncbi:unnamed protein product [Owenia fusiformis]|uniref:Uncharacterized protein n=1 Tax=Owenia fusiformis TaxID=6347 RepID=A0A8J1UNN3_OWEFU|nr:unnamed protein product [Owenia fusiformis]
MIATKRNTKGLNNNANIVSKDRLFSITIHMRTTGENFKMKKIYSEMKISELKGFAEFSTGIPFDMQRLNYLDEGDLQDHTEVRQNDIVPGATINMKVWHMWTTLVDAVAQNDIDWLFKLGVIKDSDYETPNYNYMNKKHKGPYIETRAAVALFVAAHRGNVQMCRKLIEAGADVNAKTALGRTPLHVAAATDSGPIIDLLLEKGANINEVDINGDTALDISNFFGHKGCERHLFLFRWQERAKQSRKKIGRPKMAHMHFDSAFPVWLSGKHGQIYMSEIMGPQEFQGTGFDAPKHVHHGPPQRQERTISAASTFDSLDAENEEWVKDLERQSTRQLSREKSRGSTTLASALKMPTITESENATVGGGTNTDSRGKTRDTRRGSELLLSREATDLSKASKDSTAAGKSPRKSLTFLDPVSKEEKKTKEFESWLEEKKKEDAIKLKERREKEADEKWEKEKRSREAEENELSYETWLKETKKQERKLSRQETRAKIKFESQKVDRISENTKTAIKNWAKRSKDVEEAKVVPLAVEQIKKGGRIRKPEIVAS